MKVYCALLRFAQSWNASAAPKVKIVGFALLLAFFAKLANHVFPLQHHSRPFWPRSLVLAGLSLYGAKLLSLAAAMRV
ncbi:MAG: hypothetical protein KA088_02005 [Brachymonas sp.]|jgi:hypothetical protein|nr:hypothetical protein [Brachymonas sp.]